MVKCLDSNKFVVFEIWLVRAPAHSGGGWWLVANLIQVTSYHSSRHTQR